MIRRSFAAILLLCSVVALAAEPKVEKITGAPTGIPAPLAVVLEPFSYKVVAVDGGPLAQVWFRKEIPVGGKPVEGANYGQFKPSELVGVIQFAASAKDFRGQPIKAGTYTLRYALLPSDGNHIGVAPDRDFLLLTATADDPGPTVLPKYDDLVKLSAKAAGTNHPAIFSMVQASVKALPAVFVDANDCVVLAAPVKSSGGDMPLMFIVKGVSMSF